MRISTRLATAIGLGLLLVAAVGVGPAGAHKQKSLKQVTMEFQRNLSGTDRFSGVVSSGNPRCIKGALVQLAYRPAFEGGGGSEEATIVATTRTDGTGNWAIDYEVSGGTGEFSTFAARSPKARLKPKNSRHKHICKAGASETRTILNPQFLSAG
jgi:hypothetical protein